MRGLLEIVEESPAEALRFSTDTIEARSTRLQYLKNRLERQKNLETLLLHLKNHEFVSRNKTI